METLTIYSPDGEFTENTVTAENKIVDRIEYPKEGGRLVWFRGHPIPEKYLPYPMAIYLCDSVKRLLMTCLRGGLIPIGLKRTKELCWHSLRHVAMTKHKDKYCDSGREIYRVGIKYFDEMWVHMAVIIFEFDNAWRYRLQSLIPQLKDYSVKGLRELLKLGGSWEQDKSIEKKWLMVRTAVLALYLMPKTRRRIFAFLRELNVEKVRLSEEDRYWSFHWQIFNFEGKSFQERLKIRETLKLSKNI